VVVDDELAFCGGIDLTGHRWDTSAHRVVEPARTSWGRPYGPYHEVQAMATGPLATRLGVLARDRWRALGERRLPSLQPSTEDVWPADVQPDLADVDVAIARTLPEVEEQPAIRECEALFLDSIAQARGSIYIESQYFTNDTLGDALAARLQEPDGPEIVVVSPQESHGWMEQNTMGAFRNSVFRQMIAADRYKRLRLVYPVASRAQHVATFIHSKVMVVDDELIRIGSANFSRRSMAVDSECDLAVEACGDQRVQQGIRRIRNRLLAEHMMLPLEAVADGIERMGSIRAFVDARESAEHTLVRVELPAEPEPPPSEGLRAAADPEAPLLSGSLVADVVPSADATTRRGPLRIRIFLAIVLIVSLAATAAAFIDGAEFPVLKDAFSATAALTPAFWAGIATFILANVLLLPLELIALTAGVLCGGLRGGVLALLGSLVAATSGYVAGRVVGVPKLRRWMSRRAYRSLRQLGTHGVAGVLALRLASVASAGSIHLMCGAARVAFPTYLAGTLIGLAPAMFALAGLGALLRQSLLFPSMSNALITVGAAVLIGVAAVVVRALVLIRRLGPSISRHRTRAEFG
jgi:phospholipase D1/2